jgi:hypothetical protein
MQTTSEQFKRRLLAAVFALVALVVLVAAIARSRPVTPAAQSQPTVAVVKLPGGGQRTVVIQTAHATTQTSPGGGQAQLVSATGPNGQPVLVSRPAGGGDR